MVEPFATANIYGGTSHWRMLRLISTTPSKENPMTHYVDGFVVPVPLPKTMPFDGMRMFWGGFKSFLELSK